MLCYRYVQCNIPTSGGCCDQVQGHWTILSNQCVSAGMEKHRYNNEAQRSAVCMCWHKRGRLVTPWKSGNCQFCSIRNVETQFPINVLHHLMSYIESTTILHIWILYLIITWLLCFFPASIDSSPVSTDSSLLAFLLLEPSPLQSKCTLFNKVYIVLYFDDILFYLIWNKYLF